MALFAGLIGLASAPSTRDDVILAALRQPLVSTWRWIRCESACSEWQQAPPSACPPTRCSAGISTWPHHTLGGLAAVVDPLPALAKQGRASLPVVRDWHPSRQFVSVLQVMGPWPHFSSASADQCVFTGFCSSPPASLRPPPASATPILLVQKLRLAALERRCCWFALAAGVFARAHGPSDRPALVGRIARPDAFQRQHVAAFGALR